MCAFVDAAAKAVADVGDLLVASQPEWPPARESDHDILLRENYI